VPPTAADQSVSAEEDTAKTITLAADDPDGDAVTEFSISEGPAHGSLGNIGSINCDGQTPNHCTADVSYTGNKDYNGPDQFKLTASNAQGTSELATVDITVDAVNDAPVNTVPAGPLPALQNTDTAITGISIADVDAGTDPVQVTLSSDNGALTLKTDVSGGLDTGDVSGNGTASVTATGTLDKINATLADPDGLTYKSGATFSGDDTLTVATDDQGHNGSGGSKTDTDTVGISVTAPDTAASVSTTTPTDGATDVAANALITINFSENVTATTDSFKLECPTGTTESFSVGGSGGSTITLTPTSNLPPNTTCTVTVVADQISDTDTNDPPDHMTADYVFTFKTANSPPVAVDDSYSATGNVKINVNDPNEGVLKRGTDDTLNGGSLHGFGATNATADSTVPNGSNSVTTSNGGTVVLASDGTFTYNPPPGYTGASDNFYYDLHNSGGDAVGKATISISGIIWFVDNSTSSAGDGRLTSPFKTLAGFTAINDGGTNHAKSGQTIFIGSGAYTGGVTLLNNQILIGQGASASITTISGITLAPFSQSLPSTGGTPPSLTTSSGSAVTLGSGNTIRGLNIGNTGGTGLAGNTFGTLNVADVELDVSGGPAINLTNGAFNGSFRKFSANGGGRTGSSSRGRPAASP